MEGFPSASDLVKEAQSLEPKDINQLHKKTYIIMLRYRRKYYQLKVDSFLNTTSLKEPQLSELREKLLSPIKVDNVKYSNFMEEASRRISQTFQVISGNIAELCVAAALEKIGLEEEVHYLRKKDRSDFTFYYPSIKSKVNAHRLEVKNVKLRERGTRGLAFDGDSMLGFFDDPAEFTADNIRVIDEHCKKTRGYCYIPPETLKQIKHKTQRFKSNLEVSKDMKFFVENAAMP